MEQTYPRFTPDMKKTHKILIPNMAPVQFRILAAWKTMAIRWSYWATAASGWRSWD